MSHLGACGIFHDCGMSWPTMHLSMRLSHCCGGSEGVLTWFHIHLFHIAIFVAWCLNHDSVTSLSQWSSHSCHSFFPLDLLPSFTTQSFSISPPIAKMLSSCTSDEVASSCFHAEEDSCLNVYTNNYFLFLHAPIEFPSELMCMCSYPPRGNMGYKQYTGAIISD